MTNPSSPSNQPLSASALARSIERLHAGVGGSERRRARIEAEARKSAAESSAVRMSATSRRLAERRRAKIASEKDSLAPPPDSLAPPPDSDSSHTFMPDISHRSRVIASKILGNSSASFVERASSWAETRARALEAEREARIEGSLRECTFRPQITTTSRSSGGASTTSRSTTTLTTRSSDDAVAADSALSPPGLDSHLARQEAARRMREKKNAVLNGFTGSTWTGARTTPAEFSFATASRRRTAAKELQEEPSSTLPKQSPPPYTEARAKLYLRRTSPTV